MFALHALANAIGPMLLEIVYNHSKNGDSLLGPGSMFLVASGLYAVGTFLVCFLPKIDITNGTAPPSTETLAAVEICAGEQRDVDVARINSLQQPLLDGSGSSS